MGWGGGKGVYVFLSAILLSKFNFKLNNPGVCVGGGGGGVGYPTASSQPVHLNKPKLDFVPSPSHPSCVNTVFWYLKKITAPFCEFWQNFLYIDVLIMNN